MPNDLGSPSADRLWQVIIAMGTGLASLAAIAVGHLHVRLNALQVRMDDDRNEIETRRNNSMNEIETRRSNSMSVLWSELRKMSEASADWREKQASLLAEKPTLNQIREMLDDRENRRRDPH